MKLWESLTPEQRRAVIMRDVRDGIASELQLVATLGRGRDGRPRGPPP